MIYIKDLSENTQYFFPKNIHNEQYGRVTAEIRLTLHSNLTLEDYNVYVNDDLHLDDYYTIHYNWEDIPSGEYEYVLNEEEYGLLRIGEEPKEKRQKTSKSYDNKTTNIVYYGE